MDAQDVKTIKKELMTIRLLLEELVKSKRPAPAQNNGYYCRCPNKYTGDDNFCSICGGLSLGMKLSTTVGTRP